ncbi:MAG: hypothetical protein JSR45_18250 [Proteobacteria bacterium]|nr:hypothetical protein [Pseudomonadota bacterium]
MNQELTCSESRPTGPARRILIDALADADDWSLLKEADHRIANHLSMLGGYARLKGAALVERPVEPTRPAVRALIQDVEAHFSERSSA